MKERYFRALVHRARLFEQNLTELRHEQYKHLPDSAVDYPAYEQGIQAIDEFEYQSRRTQLHSGPYEGYQHWHAMVAHHLWWPDRSFAHDKIEAIRTCRLATRLGLREAKFVIDSVIVAFDSSQTVSLDINDIRDKNIRGRCETLIETLKLMHSMFINDVRAHERQLWRDVLDR
jgi:hypothetical protein